MGRQKRYSPEVRERAVRMVREHETEYDSQWAAIRSIAGKIGCSAETLRNWVRQVERDEGRRPGLTTDEYLLGLPMTPSSHEMESPGIPGGFREWVKDVPFIPVTGVWDRRGWPATWGQVRSWFRVLYFLTSER